jgi:alpha-galactosidase
MLVLHYADLTPEEARTHWALWCFSKAPLILSMDLRQIGNYSQDDSIAYVIHNSTEILKVNQDALGK